MTKYISFERSNSPLSHNYVCFLVNLRYIQGVGMDDVGIGNVCNSRSGYGMTLV